MRSKIARCIISEHQTAHLHSRRLLFALHKKRDLDYIDVNRSNGDTRRLHKTSEEKTMNPIRIAKSWISYRRTLNELGNLSNQTLADIGVSRYDIRGIASRSFR